jgi:transcriptional regulator with XRE-family HTH domain
MKKIQVNEIELEQLRYMPLGKRLKWIREQLQALYKNGYSINQVAKNINEFDENGGVITAQGLSAIEMGKTKNPSVRTINALAEYYRIPNEALFDEYYKSNPSPFFLGDANFSAAAKSQTITCHISVSADEYKYNESLNLSPRQIDILIKRIKFEVSLLQDEQN